MAGVLFAVLIAIFASAGVGVILLMMRGRTPRHDPAYLPRQRFARREISWAEFEELQRLLEE